MAGLVSPHGGHGLRPLAVEKARVAEELRRAEKLPRVRVSSREKGDLIMLGMGGFTPLDGFMTGEDVKHVCKDMRPADGLFWPIPITLSTDDASLRAGAEIALADPDDDSLLATMKVSEQYRADKVSECTAVFRTADAQHPGVKAVMHECPYSLAGPVRVLSDGGFKA